MNINENRVREYAHQIWQSEGCPDGQAHRHWEMACELAASDENETGFHEKQSAPQHTTVQHNDLDIINKPAGKAKTKALKKSEAADAQGLKDTSVERMAPSDINSADIKSADPKSAAPRAGREKVVDEFAIEPQSAPEKVSFSKSDSKKSSRGRKAQLLNDVIDTEMPQVNSGIESV
jgi:hypothetical protein